MIKQLKRLVWRALPGASHALSTRLPYVRAWLAYGWNRRSPPAPPAEAPVIVAGFHGAVLGLGEATRGLVRALRLKDRETIAWDISERLGHARRLDEGDPVLPPAGPAVLIVQVNPVELIHLIDQTRGAPFVGRRTIGYWAWELPRMPRAWRPAFRYVDEVWTLSEFGAEAIRRDAPRRVKVRVAPLAVEVDPQPADRARFGLPADAVVVLAGFDFRSSIARKNPLGALEAFRRARALGAGPALLVFKTVGAEAAPEAVATLRAAIGEADDVVLLTEAMSPRDKDGLVASCDILLSLHRAEGFGLFPAEAMAAGKAVVATGWSGNLDFMDAESAVLVPSRPTPVRDPQGLYAGGDWAEPDLDFAARALARLIDDPAERAALGARARRAAAERLSLPAVATIVARALKDEEPA
ncbi:glycosyl transferase family 1 [Caulobacter sp. D5]|uniref:glycosyltransferase family 4 protein n=1 Tax=Caulobacter sp. D5 TaxID=357400 RepID=UPI000D73C9D3|nr:glycosyltransferase family 4 protein [Caulobacter sp. D5]PXA94287.1 glycosyl transferase family 1 [Caulobacter sp. D5]